MVVQRLIRLLPVAAGIVLLAGAAQAQTKVGIVSFTKALQDTAEIKAAQADLEARYKPRQEALAKLEKEIAKLQQEAETNQSKYTEAALAELGTQLQRKQRDYQRLGQLLQDDVNRERQDVLQRSGTRMQDIIKKLAEEKGFDMVVDVANLLYNKPALDFTAEATAAYDKAHPAKK